MNASPFARARPARAVRAAVAIALAAAALTGGALASGSRAAADPLGDAKAQAASLQEQVTSLQVQAEAATEKYDAASAALLGAIADGRAAQKKAAAARAAVKAHQVALARNAQALYTSGGTLTVYAAILDDSDPTHVLIALRDMQAVSNVNKRLLDDTQAGNAQAREADAEAAAAVDQQAALSRQAQQAQAQVQALLAQQKQALANANAQVRTIEAQIQAQIDAENAARAAQALAVARQAALQAGFTADPGSGTAQAAIAAAGTQLGKPYVYGGSGPNVWDCSGLTQWAYGQAGVGLPRTAAEQYLAVPAKVPLGQLEPGDLLFWATDPANPLTIHHVAIYLGDDRMLAAPHTGTVVQIQPVYLDGYFGAVRP